jgi:hypothetical protein
MCADPSPASLAGVRFGGPKGSASLMKGVSIASAGPQWHCLNLNLLTCRILCLTTNFYLRKVSGFVGPKRTLVQYRRSFLGAGMQRCDVHRQAANRAIVHAQRLRQCYWVRCPIINAKDTTLRVWRKPGQPQALAKTGD